MMARTAPMRAFATAAAALLLGTPGLAFAQAGASPVVEKHAQTGRPHSTGKPYAARNLADRIVLTAGADASREMGVAWRTDTGRPDTVLQWAPAVDGPTLSHFARTVTGTSTTGTSENGEAIYHKVRLTGLEPGRSYVYRVMGTAGWSEWFGFDTAPEKGDIQPFEILYFGDTQNGILEHGSRVIRTAFARSANPRLVIHAGDLVAQREEKVHDDEWGEWFEAGGFHYASIPQVPAPGNHEYVDIPDPTGGDEEGRALGDHWGWSFALPANGARGAEATTYHVDWGDVRIIVLDGTSAIDLGTLEAQTSWLDRALAESKARWNLVAFHQPIYTCARPNDTEELKAVWEPILRQRRVDLVLQGHDHCYSRLTSAEGREAGRAARRRGAAQGPVYMVSVVGSKQYGLNDRAETQPDRVAEDTQLFQRLRFENSRIVVDSLTATGRLYDRYIIERQANGRNRLIEPGTDDAGSPLPHIRRCQGETGPDGAPCTARRR